MKTRVGLFLDKIGTCQKKNKSKFQLWSIKVWIFQFVDNLFDSNIFLKQLMSLKYLLLVWFLDYDLIEFLVPNLILQTRNLIRAIIIVPKFIYYPHHCFNSHIFFKSGSRERVSYTIVFEKESSKRENLLYPGPMRTNERTKT